MCSGEAYGRLPSMQKVEHHINGKKTRVTHLKKFSERVIDGRFTLNEVGSKDRMVYVRGIYVVCI